MELPAVPSFSFASLKAATSDFCAENGIGSGATGDVFKGTLSETRVAIKRLKLPAAAAAEARAQLRRRFLAELRTLGAFQHVRLVQLRGYAIDEAADARNPFALVFELLEGGSLADWLEGAAGEPPARSATDRATDATGKSSAAASSAVGCSLSALVRIDIALGVAAGLCFLHGQEEPLADEPAAVPLAAAAGGGGAAPALRQVVLHRDVKAANIGLGLLPGGAMHAKLLDFGLARAVRGEGAGVPAAPSSTMSTSIGAGTPGYMAPELGNTGPSVQTEVYAFGIVLLELLTGKKAEPRAIATLFDDAEDAGAAGAAAVVAAKAQADVWPAGAATAIAELILACTQRRPRNRLPDMAAAASKLRAIRAALAPAAPLTAMCSACLEEVPEKEIVACPPPEVGRDATTAVAAGATGGAGAAFKGSLTERARHSVCSGCVQRHVATIEAIAIDMNGGCIPCPCPDCASPGWSLDSIADRVDKATVVSINGKLARLADAARKRRAFDAAMQEKVDRGLGITPAAAASALINAGAGTGSGTDSASKARASDGCRVPPTVDSAGAPAVGGAGAASSPPLASSAAAATSGTASTGRAPAAASGTAIAPEAIGVRAKLLADVIRERDLTLRCPRCSLPYTEISGCNAVLCGSRDAAAGVDIAAYGCGARFCGVCCREFPSAAANHAHHLTAHGNYMDKALLQRAQGELRAAAAVQSLQSFAKGAGGAALQRAVAESLGDAVLGHASLSVAALLERAGASAGASNVKVPAAGSAHVGAAPGAGAEPGAGDALLAAKEANAALAGAIKAAAGEARAIALVAWLRDHADAARLVTTLALPKANLSAAAKALVFRAFESMPQLTSLDFSGNGMGSESSHALAAAFKKLPNLRELNLSGNFDNLFDRDWDGFKAVMEGFKLLPQLRRLQLECTALKERGAKVLAAALAHTPQLEELYVSENGISSPAAVADLAAGLAHVPLLRVLDVGKNAIGPAGGAALAASLCHLPQLQVLWLRECDIRDAGLSAVLDASKGLPHLSRLSISSVRIGNAGFNALAAAMPSMPQLREVFMTDNDGGLDSAAALAMALMHAPHVQRLDCTGCFRDIDARKLLQAASKACIM